MINLIIGNSVSKIEGLNVAEFKSLRNILSYTPERDKAYISGRFGLKRYLLDKKGGFPTGLLYLVKKSITNGYTVTDNRVKSIPKVIGSKIEFIPGSRPKPYTEQVEAAMMLLRYHRGIISCPTGTGKSLIAALICHKLQLPALIVVPTKELKRQTIEVLRSYFGKNKISDKMESFITVSNIASLKPSKVITNKDLLIIDEFHHSGAKSYRKLNQKAWGNIFWRCGLTATPFRSDENERLLLESVLSEVIYRLDYKTSIEKGYIVPVEAYYVDLPRQEMEGNDRNWHSVYSELVVNNKHRNEVIIDLLNSLCEKPTLCLVKEINHGDTLSAACDIQFANGKDDRTARFIAEFNSQKFTQLIGTTGVLGEGVDTKPAEWIILAGGGKSRNQFMQQVGRGVRKYPGKTSCKVILFRDKSHKYLLKHFNACVKYLKEYYGVIPVKLDVFS